VRIWSAPSCYRLAERYSGGGRRAQWLNGLGCPCVEIGGKAACPFGSLAQKAKKADSGRGGRCIGLGGLVAGVFRAAW